VRKAFRGIFDILTSRSDIIVVKKYNLGITLLSVAAQGVSNPSARAYIMATLIDKYGMDPNSKDDWGFTPLIYAAQYSEVSTYCLLLDRGAEADCRYKDGITPLMRAAQRGHLGIIKLLVNRGNADVNSRGPAGKTLLFNAVQNPYAQDKSLSFTQAQAAQIEILNFLLSRDGVFPGTLDHAGNNASFYARRLKLYAVETLLDHAVKRETGP
jgi:ankyrin repeat protein